MEPATLIIIAVLILSIVIHEVSHGFMANWLGDPTARLAGRLTLNPISHIDPVGSVLLPALLVFMGSPLLIGYAKPVPYNPYNLRNRKWGEALVAFAGPGVNLILALVFGIIFQIAASQGASDAFLELSQHIVHLNVLLALFNLIPIPPADGSKVIGPFLPYRLALSYQALGARLEMYGIFFLFAFILLFGGPFYTLVNALTRLLLGG